MTLPLLLLLFQSKGSLSGTVTDSLTGAPIRKAQVHIAGPSSSLAVTDASGSFLFDQVPSGNYGLTAVHPEYPPSRAQNAAGHLPVQLAAGERKTSLDLKLTPAASLSGRIVDDEGDPLPNCAVTLFANSVFGALVFGSASTKRTGEYALPPVPAGKYYMEARCFAPVPQPRPFAPPQAALAGPKLGYGSRFYPNAKDLSAAQKLIAKPGQNLSNLNFRMSPEPLSSLTLHIAGAAAARLSATLSPDDGSPKRQSNIITGGIRNPAEVHFASVPAGRYILRVQSANPERLLLAKQQVTVGEEPGELAIQIAPPIPLAGTLRTPASPNPPLIQIALERIDEPGFHLQTELKPDGSFAFRGVSQGRYRIGNLENTWVQSVSVGGEVTEGPEFELKPGASGPLEITTGSELASFSGDIDIGSARPASIALIATSSFVQLQLDALTGQSPHFTGKLPPGRYRLYAVESTPGGDIFRLLEHEDLVSKGQTVDLRANSETVRNLKLITAEEIEKADQ